MLENVTAIVERGKVIGWCLKNVDFGIFKEIYGFGFAEFISLRY